VIVCARRRVRGHDMPRAAAHGGRSRPNHLLYFPLNSKQNPKDAANHSSTKSPCQLFLIRDHLQIFSPVKFRCLPTFGTRASNVPGEMSRHSGHSIGGDCNNCTFSLSPPPHRSCHRSSKHVVERVIERSSSNTVYPTLTQSIYTKWWLIMMVNL
jgi:hypothetical protein